MPYRLIIFDFDGTLADTFPWFAGVINQVADQYKFKRIGPDEVETIRGYEGRQILKHLGVPFWKAPLIANDLRRRMTQDIKAVSLFPGVRDFLQSLVDRGVDLAVVSSNLAENIGYVLGQDIATLFSDYACGVSMFGKERKLRSIVKKSGVAQDAVIYVGDEIRDLHSARKVGIAFGAVSWGYNRIEAIQAHGPDWVFESVEDMREKLKLGR
jgi:phosphoglycolate phosphatase